DVSWPENLRIFRRNAGKHRIPVGLARLLGGIWRSAILQRQAQEIGLTMHAGLLEQGAQLDAQGVETDAGFIGDVDQPPAGGERRPEPPLRRREMERPGPGVEARR